MHKSSVFRVLEKNKKELKKNINMVDQDIEPVQLDQAVQGRLSRIDSIQKREMALAIKRMREVQIMRIDAAIERLNLGSYGFCVSCDEQISSKRLELDPSEPQCLDCALIR